MRMVNLLKKHGIEAVLEGDDLNLIGLKKLSPKRARNVIALARKNRIQLKTELKACPGCPYHKVCEHELAFTVSFFVDAFKRHRIIPRDGYYLVDGKERYKAALCELAIIEELWATCPEGCRYCIHASTDNDGDWWCSHPVPGEEGRYIFRNLALIDRCPKKGTWRVIKVAPTVLSSADIEGRTPGMKHNTTKKYDKTLASNRQQVLFSCHKKITR